MEGNGDRGKRERERGPFCKSEIMATPRCKSTETEDVLSK